MSEFNSTKNPPVDIDINEEFIRVFYHPDHIDGLGNFMAAAIREDDLLDRGFSVYRKEYTESAFIEGDVSKALGKEGLNKKVAFFGLIGHKEVMDIQDADGNGALQVEYVPTPTNKAHAHILCKRKYSRSQIKKFKKDLADRFQRIPNLDAVFS